MVKRISEMRDLIYKYALKNAWEHGQAKAKPVVSKVLGEKKELRKNAKVVIEKTKEIVQDVNGLSSSEINEELEKIAPEFLEEEEPEEEGLPDLPNVEGEIRMRMAPFPSGPLHIGNARMALLNDMYVKKYDGELLLVIDDTIGSEEKPPIKEAYEWVKQDLEWLGIDYDETYLKSDRMQLYYSWAEKLIKKGAAYVCHCSSEKIGKYREEGKACNHRERSIDENLEEWGKMLAEEYTVGEAVLRAKTDIEHPDPAFRDRVLFRISNREHPKVGTKYHVWPMLEVSWGVDDYELGITHILRGKDLVIEDKMETWLWDVFGIEERPEFIHYGLLGLESGTLSKSTARKKIQEGRLEGWDDPRTWSILSLKKRGFKPESIRQFIRELGLSLADNEMPLKILYSINRSNIDKESNRYFCIINEKQITIEGKNEFKPKLPKHPNIDRGTRKFTMGPKILIEQADYNTLQKEKKIRLQHFCNIEYGDGTVRYAKDQNTLYNLPIIHWLPAQGNLKGTILMPDGEKKKVLVENNIMDEQIGNTIQFVRVGFGRIDSKKPLIIRYTH